MAEKTLEDILNAISAGPPAAASSTLPDPIGVPADYAAVRDYPDYVPGSGTPPYRLDEIVPPRYFEGDDWQPATMSVEQRARLQRQLAAAGLIPEGAEYRIGMWDETSRQAFRTLLTYANAGGTDWQDALQRYAEAERANKPKFEATPYLAPDNATLVQKVKATIRESLNRDPTQAEIDTLTGMLRTQDRAAYDAETSAKRSAFEAEPGAAPTVVQDIDPVARFNEVFEQRYKPELERVDGVQAGQKMRESFIGNVGDMDSLIARTA